MQVHSFIFIHASFVFLLLCIQQTVEATNRASENSLFSQSTLLIRLDLALVSTKKAKGKERTFWIYCIKEKVKRMGRKKKWVLKNGVEKNSAGKKLSISKIQWTPLNRATSGPTLYVSNKRLELLSGGLI